MRALFDQGLLSRRVARRVDRDPAQWAHHDFVYRQTAETLRDRLQDIKRPLPAMLEIGWPNPVADDALRQAKHVTTHDTVTLPALAGGVLPVTPGIYDALISHLVLHWADDPAVMLQQYLFALKPDGVFAGCVLGGDSLQELRDVLAQAEQEVSGGISPRVSPMLQVQDLAGLMQQTGFALPVVDVERVMVTYSDVMGLLRDLRAVGQANSLLHRRRQPLGKRFWARVQELYAQRYADPRGRVMATLDIVYLLGWSPDASQPQPKRRGSATVHLSDVLKP